MWFANKDAYINALFNKYPAETIFLSWLCNTSEIISKTPSPERSLKKNWWLVPGYKNSSNQKEFTAILK